MTKYKIASVLIVAVYFFQTFFVSYGGIGADSLSYFGIAADLPHPETNLFPLGYPILLRLLFEWFNDYFWASKILNIVLVMGILLFSYGKKFYFRETVLLFMGKTFLFVFLGAMSETVFLFFIYFLFFLLHRMFTQKENLYLYALGASLCMIILFAVRYSGIYIYASLVIFCLVWFFKIKNEMYGRPVLSVAVLSGLGIGSYLLFNYLHFGSFTGENLRGRPEEMPVIYIIRDFFGLINSIDPFIGIKPASNSWASIMFQVLIFIADLFVLWFFVKYFRKAKGTALYFFHILLWIMAVVYGVSLTVSGWFQQIEEMGVRMLAASNLCLFFSFLILYFQNTPSDRRIWRVSCVFMVFLIIYSLKDPGNYLENKKQIVPQMAKFKGKKYLFNDEKGRVTHTTYHFPVIDKSFRYVHTNNQQGSLKEKLAGTVNPEIKWLKYDTVKDKSKILYTSALRFK